MTELIGRGCRQVIRTCTDPFPYPFLQFPIYIFNDNNLGAHVWLELFPEAYIVENETQLNLVLSQVGNSGVLVISASGSTALCRDLFLNIIVASVNIMTIKDYNGFFIDNYDVDNGTEIYELLAPRQQLRTANNRPSYLLRSYWVRNSAHYFNDKGCYDDTILELESQLFPGLVSRQTLPSIAEPTTVYLLLFFLFLFFLAILYWILILLAPLG